MDYITIYIKLQFIRYVCRAARIRTWKRAFGELHDTVSSQPFGVYVLYREEVSETTTTIYD